MGFDARPGPGGAQVLGEGRPEDAKGAGLGTDLQLVATDEEFPFKDSVWRHRFGLAVANRLNGICVETAAGGNYTDPTIV